VRGEDHQRLGAVARLALLRVRAGDVPRQRAVRASRPVDEQGQVCVAIIPSLELVTRTARGWASM